MKDEIERIESDIKLFERNIEKIDLSNANEQVIKIVELARQYYEDTKHYLKKEDHFTALGCINYAHGLIDAINS
jgi:hypothetical protein